MTIEELFTQGKIKEIINKVAVGRNENITDLEDLAQDLVLILLEKKDTFEKMDEKEQIYYLSRLACNNIRSTTSRYYYQYIKPKKPLSPIDSYKEEDDDRSV